MTDKVMGPLPPNTRIEEALERENIKYRNTGMTATELWEAIQEHIIT